MLSWRTAVSGAELRSGKLPVSCRSRHCMQARGRVAKFPRPVRPERESGTGRAHGACPRPAVPVVLRPGARSGAHAVRAPAALRHGRNGATSSCAGCAPRAAAPCVCGGPRTGPGGAALPPHRATVPRIAEGTRRSGTREGRAPRAAGPRTSARPAVRAGWSPPPGGGAGDTVVDAGRETGPRHRTDVAPRSPPCSPEDVPRTVAAPRSRGSPGGPRTGGGRGCQYVGPQWSPSDPVHAPARL